MADDRSGTVLDQYFNNPHGGLCRRGVSDRSYLWKFRVDGAVSADRACAVLCSVLSEVTDCNTAGFPRKAILQYLPELACRAQHRFGGIYPYRIYTVYRRIGYQYPVRHTHYDQYCCRGCSDRHLYSGRRTSGRGCDRRIADHYPSGRFHHPDRSSHMSRLADGRDLLSL